MIEKRCPYHSKIRIKKGICECQEQEFNEVLGKMERCLAEPKDTPILYFCNHHFIPLYDSVCKCCEDEGLEQDVIEIGTDIRPVFPEEQLLLGVIMDKDKPFQYVGKSVWHNGYCYLVDGNKVKISIDELKNKSLDEIDEMRKIIFDCIGNPDDEGFHASTENNDNLRYKDFYKVVELFVKANNDRYCDILLEATGMIRQWADGYESDQMMVSFSGGKDSTVVSSLVRNALAQNTIRHLYGDTTLEFVMTENYKTRFRKNVVAAGYFTTAKNRTKNFEEMCPVYGPPSRVMRWCCTVFKTGAITDTINKAYKGQTRILSFQGIRKYESASRSKYERESDNSKIAKQKTVLPIFEWTDFDVWLYILKERIDFNDAYRLGYTRVGCWCCPNNGAWSEFLSKIYMYDRFVHWRNILIDYAKQVGKTDPEEYVDSGNWKARQGGNGLESAKSSILSYEPCAIEEDTITYELQIPINDGLYELFKPFGRVDFSLGNAHKNEVYVVDRNGNPVLILKGRKGTTTFKVTIKDKKHIDEGKINCQITKFQMCSACRACKSVCKMGAIRITESQDGEVEYKIDDEKCVHCGECINHFNGGCYMRKVLTIRRN